MKVIDIVKPTERTALDSDFVAPPIGFGSKKIEVIGETEEEAIARRTKDWPKYDPDPNHCSGKGQRVCLQQGKHSEFNHSQDTMSGDNYPPGFDRSLDE